jgi:hypothetical protein
MICWQQYRGADKSASSAVTLHSIRGLEPFVFQHCPRFECKKHTNGRLRRGCLGHGGCPIGSVEIFPVRSAAQRSCNIHRGGSAGVAPLCWDRYGARGKSTLWRRYATSKSGQLITLEGTLRYREYEEDVHGLTVRHRAAEIHATSMKRLSKIEAADDSSDGAGDE